MLKRAQKDMCAANELIGYVCLSIRQSGHLVTSEYVMQECNLPDYTSSKFHPFYTKIHIFVYSQHMWGLQTCHSQCSPQLVTMQ